MLELMVVFSFIVFYGYAILSIKRGYIVMRMPDGSRVHYDKNESRRGYLVSISVFFVSPIFMFIFYLMDSA